MNEAFDLTDTWLRYDVLWGIRPEYEEQLMADAVAQAQKTLRNRIDK